MFKKTLRIISTGLALSLTLFTFSSCNVADSGELSLESDKITVAVSIPPQEEFIKEVCGDSVEVITMIPSGNSPENYEPTPQEIAKFSDSAVYFSIGVPTEEENIKPNISENTKLVELDKTVGETYPDLKLGEERDPHIWLSPKRAVVMVNEIAKTMSEIDENNAEIYNANAKIYIEKIEKMDEELLKTSEQLSTKEFIVFHPAFGYLADDFGFTMHSLEEEGKEATPTHLAEMIDFAKENNIKVIFYQAEIDSSQSKSFAEELGGTSVMLDPLSPKYLENLQIMVNTISEEISK